MVITKIFNNNCVLVRDGNHEVVITGAGVGFQKRPGENVDIKRIEKKFQLVDEYRDNFELLVTKVPFEYFMITEAIVDRASEMLDTEINSKIMVTLTDYISLAIERSQSAVNLPTLFEREMKTFFPKEYEIGVWAREFIEDRLNVKLRKEEAGFIALHILNASSDSLELYASRSALEFARVSIEIIEKSLEIEIDKQSIAFHRTVTHLKFLGKYIIEKGERNMPESVGYDVNTIDRFSLIQPALDNIRKYIKETYHFELNEDEYLYLSLHVYQVANKARVES